MLFDPDQTRSGQDGAETGSRGPGATQPAPTTGQCRSRHPLVLLHQVFQFDGLLDEHLRPPIAKQSSLAELSSRRGERFAKRLLGSARQAELL